LWKVKDFQSFKVKCLFKVSKFQKACSKFQNAFSNFQSFKMLSQSFKVSSFQVSKFQVSKFQEVILLHRFQIPTNFSNFWNSLEKRCPCKTRSTTTVSTQNQSYHSRYWCLGSGKIYESGFNNIQNSTFILRKFQNIARGRTLFKFQSLLSI
jgi:hypothetical protein